MVPSKDFTSESVPLEEVSIDIYKVIDSKVANKEIANYPIGITPRSKYTLLYKLTCKLNIEGNNSIYIF